MEEVKENEPKESKYDFAAVENKWQKRWAEMGLFRTGFNAGGPKYYALTMYPYPSGVLHMGHVINYTIGDVIVRYKILQGYDVLSPMGWDSFGLPAENAAIRTGVHPHEFTEKNIAKMTAQMQRAGWGYNWAREVATSHADYYHWNQWFFHKFYERGLVVKKTAPVNWCAACQTVLANEQVKDGKCERCGSEIEQKDMSQWFFTMSKYAQRLLDGHEHLRGNWPDAVLAMQEEWIGRSTGAKVIFKIKETNEELPIFTTRPDTLFGVTFLAIAPEHPLLEKLLQDTPQAHEVFSAIKKMRAQGTSAKDLADREKIGIATGFHVINPVNNEIIPLWVANFALMSYGTGVVMSVPAHDQRDFEFAKKYNLPIKIVIQPQGEMLSAATMNKAFVDAGTMVNSDDFNGRVNTAAMNDIISWLTVKNFGEGTINYRLRDWLISRQRYWGTPIPIIYCEKCGMVLVPENDLPVKLPTDVEFKGDGNPLAKSQNFLNCQCPQCGGDAQRETDTMDTFVDSSWYFLRYCDAKNANAPFTPESVKKWMPVDEYVGGIEHATMHLIYARFFTMALYDLGLVDFTEPFKKLFCQGMVCKTAYRCAQCKWLPISEVEFSSAEAETLSSGVVGKCKKCGGETNAEMTKISKTKLNIVDPDTMFDRVGADVVRLYMLSDAPPDRMQIWSETGLTGAWRTLNRLRLTVLEWTSGERKIAQVGELAPSHPDRTNRELIQKTHQCIIAVTDAIDGGFCFNTAIARCNELLNQLRTCMADKRKTINGAVAREVLETIITVLAPIVPHFAEEMWELLGYEESIFRRGWPQGNPQIAKESKVEIPIQINGKLRLRMNVFVAADAKMLEKEVLENAKVKELLDNQTIIKIIAVPGRMVNIVAN